MDDLTVVLLLISAFSGVLAAAGAFYDLWEHLADRRHIARFSRMRDQITD